MRFWAGNIYLFFSQTQNLFRKTEASVATIVDKDLLPLFAAAVALEDCAAIDLLDAARRCEVKRRIVVVIEQRQHTAQQQHAVVVGLYCAVVSIVVDDCCFVCDV